MEAIQQKIELSEQLEEWQVLLISIYHFLLLARLSYQLSVFLIPFGRSQEEQTGHQAPYHSIPVYTHLFERGKPEGPGEKPS